ncbi:hypothetical protein [Leisingera sp. ANG59]|uniref:hypothetical protein n=1 Tax=Leisingera sp. ANG59 TaxID=2675221 RepID=UPI001572E8F6|nr:hypothetical protein [Leisingera sp. ANG59]NSY39539.1 hypothetical protein [Leisingera sp. ANG59]
MSALQPAPLCPGLDTFTASRQDRPLQAARTDLGPGVFLNADPALQLAGSYSSPAGYFLDLSAAPAGSGSWFGLHVVLQLPPLQGIAYLGFACRLASPEPQTLRASLRSGTHDGGFSDCFFDKHILASERAHSHLDALYLDCCPDLPLSAPWRELVLFLPCRDFDLNLMHLHLFAV